MIIEENKARQMMVFPKNFDFGLIDQEYGFQQKIFQLVAEPVFQSLETENPTAYHYLIKAGLHYAFVLDLPKIKVHLSNYGVNQYEQGTTKNANWWDVRDLAISWLKKADFYASKGVEELKGRKADILFYQQECPVMPYEVAQQYFGKISPEVYLHLCSMMQELVQELLTQLTACSIDELMKDEALARLLRSYLYSATLTKAMEGQRLGFLTTGIVMQYEELPWQKSVVLTESQRRGVALRYAQDRDRAGQLLMNYIAQHRDQFPCLAKADTEPAVRIIKGKGGLYL